MRWGVSWPSGASAWVLPSMLWVSRIRLILVEKDLKKCENGQSLEWNQLIWWHLAAREIACPYRAPTETKISDAGLFVAHGTFVRLAWANLAPEKLSTIWQVFVLVLSWLEKVICRAAPAPTWWCMVLRSTLMYSHFDCLSILHWVGHVETKCQNQSNRLSPLTIAHLDLDQERQILDTDCMCN